MATVKNAGVVLELSGREVAVLAAILFERTSFEDDPPEALDIYEALIGAQTDLDDVELDNWVPVGEVPSKPMAEENWR